MTTQSQLPLRACLTFILGCLIGTAPLSAQLDPRLQSGKTDLLDLYQKSTTVKVKPEILTVFDYSGSMQALMFHPQYVNNDTGDGAADSRISFTLTGGVNTYEIRATSLQNPRVWASATVVLGQNGIVSRQNSGDQYEPYQTSGGADRRLYAEVSNISVSPVQNVTTGSTYSFSATLSLWATTTGGSGRLLSGYPGTLNGGIRWSVSGPIATTMTPASTTATVNTSNNSWTSPSQSSSWVAPASSTVSGASVTATLAGTAVGTMTTTQLVKPDGSLVTATDAANASASSGLYGASFGASDVRNWVRAASHARFSITHSGNTRTVDIPIPWKIMDRSSSGNPLTSAMAADPTVTIAAPGGGTTSYGSGTQIEMDLNYKMAGGSLILEGDENQQTSTRLISDAWTYTYKRPYIDWLMTGTYADGTYAGRYIVFDAENASLAGGQGNVSWGRGFGPAWGSETLRIPVYSPADGTYTGETTIAASRNVVPARTRIQAVKEAAIRTWIAYQNKVFWAIRCLDTSASEANGGAATEINNNSTTSIDTRDVTTNRVNGGDSGWTLLNNTAAQGMTSASGNSVVGMRRIASYFAANSTPLTYAMARGLAQFTDPNSVFNAVQTGDNKPNQCGSHALILFTDGLDNNATNDYNDNTYTPYLTNITTPGGTAGNALEGNQRILDTTNSGKIDRSGSWWNLFTYAGIGAHMADSTLKSGAVNGTDYKKALDPGTGVTTGVPSSFLPFAIKSRNTGVNKVTFDVDHRIWTMTVGVSLGGRYTDSGSPKRSLFVAAAVGDPSIRSWDLGTLAPFERDPDPNDTTGTKFVRRRGTICFFDATDPLKLVDSLDAAFNEIVNSGVINTASNPNLPFIGASLGKEILLGKFVPTTSGIWSGDLFAFNTKQLTQDQTINGTFYPKGSVIALDRAGAPVFDLGASAAIWSTSTAMRDNRLWKNRTLYTRLPNNESVGTLGGLVPFSDTGTTYTDGVNGLKNYVARGGNAASYPVGSAAQQAVIQFAMGGDTSYTLDGDGRPTRNRGAIMGDIINSAPSALEYKFSDVSSAVQARAAYSSVSGGNRFRLVLVGTNQGWLHAFGEVTKEENANTADPATPKIVKGAVDELWSFMPTDFLANLDYLKQESNAHKYMVDGTPQIYHLDLPPSAGGFGNGIVDSGEKATVIIGLRKGGRSYYALDIRDPFAPKLKWSLVPDEYSTTNKFPTARIETNGPSQDAVTAVVMNMGFSTCTPAIGRILFNNIVRDVVFLGGGFSVPEVEANFAGTPKLGRSVIALDVNTGKVLAVADLTDSALGGSTVGPVAAGVVPFEFILNSGMAQRAYFLDYYGGLWSWGSQKRYSGAPYDKFRMDSSRLNEWTSDGTSTGTVGIRKVFQDGTGAAAKYSTLPSPFRAGNFPGAGKTGQARPAAVGIAMSSGDRNNPLDNYDTMAAVPSRHRTTVVFDRQDSNAWGLDSTGILDTKLIEFAETDSQPDARITRTSAPSSYYLAPTAADGSADEANTKFGYYIRFPAPVAVPANKPKAPNPTEKFVPKGVNTPLVVAGSLYYSYFWPDSFDVCSGGSGYTHSWRLCDVYNPVVKTPASSTAFCKSGEIDDDWYGIASDFSAIGTRGVIQAGVIGVTNSEGKTVTHSEFHTSLGQQRENYPKARVWRTVQ